MTLLENAKVLAGGLGAAILRPEEKQMSKLLENCKRLDYDPDQPRDENGRWGNGPSATHAMNIRGNTYPHRDALRLKGFRFLDAERGWEKQVDHTVGLLGRPDDPDNIHFAERTALAAAGHLPAWSDTQLTTTKLLPSVDPAGNRIQYTEAERYAEKPRILHTGKDFKAR